jgi:cob(I)alamin adenosyltransferase
MASICTGNGDSGQSGLMGGGRAPKSDPRFEALGALDELSAALGLAKVISTDPLRTEIAQVQAALLAIGAELATPSDQAERYMSKFISTQAPDELREKIRAIEGQGRQFEGFVLPGSHELNARLHMARAIARRAERMVWALKTGGQLARDTTAIYLNRLSDLLWLWAE